MCLIIDINVAHKIFSTNSDPDFKDIHKALFITKKSNTRIVYSGDLVKECKNTSIRRILIELDRAGRASRINDQDVKVELEIINRLGICVSDDQHIIALARASNVRLLCSHDQKLHIDFTNKQLIDNPRGKVYQNAKHKGLLRKFCY